MKVHVLCLCVLTRFLPMVKTDFPEIHNTSTADDRLMRYLLDEERYNRFVRPVKHHDEKLIVAIRLVPTAINLVDQEFIVHTFVAMEWEDDFLKWKVKANDEIAELYIPVNRIWFPQISLMNSLNERDQDYFWDARISVMYYGLVRWTPWAKFKAPCPMDLWQFPLDEQTCKLEFRRRYQDTHLVELQPWTTKPHIKTGPIVLDYYTKNNAWEITGHSALRKEAISENYIPRPAVTFTFNLRRRDSYLRLMFVGPAVVLALLTPVLFLLPPHDTGKFTLGGTLMICTSIFLVMMKQYLPTSTDSLPALCVYYIVTFILLALSLVLSALTNNIANRNMRMGKLADALKKIRSTCLGRLLLLPNTEYGISTSHMELQEQNSDDTGLKISKPRALEDCLLVVAVLDRILCLIFTVIVIITSLALLL